MGLVPGLDEAEFFKWLDIITLDPTTDLAPEDDIVTRLWDAGFTHIFHQAAQAGVRKSWGADFLTYTSHNVDSTQRLLEAVEKVDTAMCRIRDAGKVKARDRIAVLAALNLAFDAERKPDAALHANGFAQPEATLTGLRNLADDVRLAQLMVRLDQALGDDGRLL